MLVNFYLYGYIWNNHDEKKIQRRMKQHNSFLHVYFHLQ